MESVIFLVLYATLCSKFTSGKEMSSFVGESNHDGSILPNKTNQHSQYTMNKGVDSKREYFVIFKQPSLHVFFNLCLNIEPFSCIYYCIITLAFPTGQFTQTVLFCRAATPGTKLNSSTSRAKTTLVILCVCKQDHSS